MDITQILLVIFASSGFWTLLSTILTNFGTSRKALNRAVVGILHDKIYDLCVGYIQRGYITAEEMENLEYVYKPYVALGGNGTGKKLYEEVQGLPKRIE